MYVIMINMKALTYIDAVSQKCWYLWNSTPCCLKKSSNKSKDTRSKILLSAFTEIYRKGFQAASLSSILKNTGITKGALYHHFDNKVELGYAVLDEVIRDTIYSTWIKPLNNTNDPITVLNNTLIHSGSLMTQKDVCLGCPLNNLAQEMSPIDNGFRDRITGIYKEWQDAIEASLERGKIAGNIDKTINSKDIALLFIATLQGCLGYAKSVQQIDVLMTCGKGLVDRLESMRPSI